MVSHNLYRLPYAGRKRYRRCPSALFAGGPPGVGQLIIRADTTIYTEPSISYRPSVVNGKPGFGGGLTPVAGVPILVSSVSRFPAQRGVRAEQWTVKNRRDHRFDFTRNKLNC